MSLKALQHQRKCYCNNVTSACCNSNTNCFKRRMGGGCNRSAPNKRNKQNYCKSDAENGQKTTNFVQINRRATDSSSMRKNRRGLGHSHNASGANFSRRNSVATTVTFSTPCTTPPGMLSSIHNTPRSSPRTILKAPAAVGALSNDFRTLSVSPQSSRSNVGGALQHEFTERRRNYQNLTALIGLEVLESGYCGNYACADGLDEERLRTLQKFRLENVNDCFNTHRQQDLQLAAMGKEQQQRMNARHTHELWSTLLERINTPTKQDQDEQCENNSCSSKKVVGKVNEKGNNKQKEMLEKDATLTPYAVRQKLLQLRLEAEQIARMKPGRKLYGGIEKSCALRFQETY